MTSRYFLVTALLASASALGQATTEPAAPPAMTLPQALQFAAEHQPSLLAARARVEAARREVDIPRGAWLPRAGVTAQVIAGTENNSTASYLSTSAMDVPRIGGSRATPPTSWAPSASTLVGVGLRQEVYDFGRLGALITAFDSAAQAEAASADADRLDVSLAVTEAYLGVHAAREVLVAAQAAEQRVQLHRDLAQAGVRSGLRSPIELTRAEADLARIQVNRVQAQGGLKLARVVFAAAVGVPDRALDAAGQPPTAGPVPELSQAQLSASQDPFVRRAQAQRAQQQALSQVYRSELLPDLSLSAGLTGRAGGAPPTSGAVPLGNGFLPDVPNWDVGLLLSWTIFDAASLARASASVIRERQRAAEESLARQRFDSAVAASWERLSVALASVPALERAAQAATSNYEQADARFKAGLGSSVELADAEALRLQAEVDLAIGNFEQGRARARLARALAEGL